MIKNDKDNLMQFPMKSLGTFSNAQGQLIPQTVVGFGLVSKLIELLCKLSFLASMEKIQLKISEIMRVQRLLHTEYMGVSCCHGNQSSNLT